MLGWRASEFDLLISFQQALVGGWIVLCLLSLPLCLASTAKVWRGFALVTVIGISFQLGQIIILSQGRTPTPEVFRANLLMLLGVATIGVVLGITLFATSLEKPFRKGVAVAIVIQAVAEIVLVGHLYFSTPSVVTSHKPQATSHMLKDPAGGVWRGQPTGRRIEVAFLRCNFRAKNRKRP